MRASHVIKGASSNLMCQELRECATNLEQAAAGANDINREDKAALEEEATKVREKHAELTKAVENYHEMLNSVEIWCVSLKSNVYYLSEVNYYMRWN